MRGLALQVSTASGSIFLPLLQSHFDGFIELDVTHLGTWLGDRHAPRSADWKGSAPGQSIASLLSVVINGVDAHVNDHAAGFQPCSTYKFCLTNGCNNLTLFYILTSDLTSMCHTRGQNQTAKEQYPHFEDAARCSLFWSDKL